MTRDDLLKKGCEVVGLEWDDPEQLVSLETPWGLHIHHPALPAYVASLLGRIRDSLGMPLEYEMEIASLPDCPYAAWEIAAYSYAKKRNFLLTGRNMDDADYLRIAAALVALGHITEDEAREALR